MHDLKNITISKKLIKNTQKFFNIKYYSFISNRKKGVKSLLFTKICYNNQWQEKNE